MSKLLLRASLYLGMIGMLLLGSVVPAAADEQEIEMQLQSVDPPVKDTSPAHEEEATGGGLDGDDPNPGGTNPGGSNPGGATGPGGTNPGGSNPGGTTGPGGANPDGSNPGGATGPGGANPGGSNPGGKSGPGGANPGGSNPGGTTGPGGANPDGSTPGGATGPGGANPGGSNPGGTTGPGGANPDGSSPGGATGPGGANPDGSNPGGTTGPGGANPGGSNPGGATGPGGANPDGSSPGGATGPGGANPDGSSPGGATGPGGANPDGNNPGGANGPEGANPGDPGGANPGGTLPDPNANPGSVDKPGKPWWERVGDWFASDTAKDLFDKIGRGLVVGIAGAAIVLGVVAVAALVLGIAISAPVWIIAAAAGVVAGLIYSFTAGDGFSYLSGIATSAMASLSVFAFAYAGIGAAARTAFQFLRTNGLGGLGGLIRTAASGAWTGMRTMMARGMAANFASLGKSLISKNVLIQFGLGNLISFTSIIATKGVLPTSGELGEMLLDNVLGAFIFGKAVDVITGKTASKLMTRTTNFVASALESAVGNLFKGEKKSLGEIMQESVLKALVIGPFAARLFRSQWLYNLRGKSGIGITIADIKNKYGVDVSVVPGRKTITNKKLEELLTADPNHLTQQQIKWLSSGTLTQRQLDKLMKNEEKFQQFVQHKQFVTGKLLEEANKETGKWVEENKERYDTQFQNIMPNLSK